MATYFVNASGSDTPPFNSKATGASSFQVLQSWRTAQVPAYFQDDDIEVVADGVVDDSSVAITLSVGHGNTLTIQSYGTDGTDRIANKPVILVASNSKGLNIEAANGASEINGIVENLLIYKDESVGALSGSLLRISSPMYATLVSKKCELWCALTKDNSRSDGIVCYSSNPALQVTNAIIRNVRNGITGLGIPIDHFKMANCSIFDFTGTAVHTSISLVSGGVFANNILHGNNRENAIGISFPTGIDYAVSYCNIFGCPSGSYGGIFSEGSNNVLTNPLFVDPENGDMKLKIGSPCIDSGRQGTIYDDVPIIDFRGQSRPVLIPGYPDVDNGHDMGAYEMLAAELTTTQPTNWLGYPKLGNVTKTTAEVLIKTNKDGNAYFVVLASTATAPTSVQVKAGTNADDETLSANLFGNTVLLANVEASMLITDLIENQKYVIYIVAEANLQDTPATISFPNLTVDDPNTPMTAGISEKIRVPDYSDPEFAIFGGATTKRSIRLKRIIRRGAGILQGSSGMTVEGQR